MRLKDAIKLNEQIVNSYKDTMPNCDVAKKYRQICWWLKELQEKRKYDNRLKKSKDIPRNYFD